MPLQAGSFASNAAVGTLRSLVIQLNTPGTVQSWNWIRRNITQRYVIEREIPAIGSFSGDQLKSASATSCDALRKLAPKVQWEHSYVTNDKTFCVYLAEDEAAVRKHAEVSGFPANRITKVISMIDPTTAG